MDVQAYVQEDGFSPFQEWFAGLDPMAATKVAIAQSRLLLGNTSNIKWFSGIGEYKINWGPGYRIYLAQDGKDLIILYAGGTKKDQQSDINQALMLHQEYQRRQKRRREQDAQAIQDNVKPTTAKKPRKRK